MTAVKYNFKPSIKHCANFLGEKQKKIIQPPTSCIAMHLCECMRHFRITGCNLCSRALKHKTPQYYGRLCVQWPWHTPTDPDRWKCTNIKCRGNRIPLPSGKCLHMHALCTITMNKPMLLYMHIIMLSIFKNRI